MPYCNKHKRICPVCKNIFVIKRQNSKYCSLVCRSKGVTKLSKRCNRCGIVKERKEFYIRKSGTISHLCKDCQKKYVSSYRLKNKDKIRNWHKNYKKTKNGKIISRRAYLKKKFGITEEQYFNMYKKQRGLCAICKELIPYRKLVVDHNHKHGYIRKLLCNRCNLGLGCFDESPYFLERAVEYLEYYIL